MKKTLQLLLFLLATSSLSLAQIPNAGMENWTNMTFYEDPTGWTTFNSFSLLSGAPPTVTKTTDAHSGTYAASLESILGPGSSELPGILISLDANGNGFANTQRYATFSFWYKFNNAGGDTAMVAASFTKWNPVTQNADSVAVAIALVTNTTNTWTQMNIPFQYFTGQTPDTAYIGAFSTITDTFIPGSVLKVDDFSFSGIASVSEVISNGINIYPNPASSELFVDFENPIKGDLLIYDLSGRIVLNTTLSDVKTKISVATLPKNTYLYNITDRTGKILKSGRIQLGQ